MLTLLPVETSVSMSCKAAMARSLFLDGRLQTDVDDGHDSSQILSITGSSMDSLMFFDKSTSSLTDCGEGARWRCGEGQST